MDTFVVLDGLPIVPEDSKDKLIKYLLKKLNTVGRTSTDAIYMPLSDKKMSEGWVIQILEVVAERLMDDIDLRSLNTRPPSKPWRPSNTSTERPWTRSTRSR